MCGVMPVDHCLQVGMEDSVGPIQPPPRHHEQHRDEGQE
jgi:hypothetical protein